eukprot:2027711-Pyramimonas_sp.AAC.1
MFLFITEFENFEQKRQRNSGTALIDFRVHAGEGIDQTLARLEIARYEAEAAGFTMPSFQILAAIQYIALGVGTS